MMDTGSKKSANIDGIWRAYEDIGRRKKARACDRIFEDCLVRSECALRSRTLLCRRSSNESILICSEFADLEEMKSNGLPVIQLINW